MHPNNCLRGYTMAFFLCVCFVIDAVSLTEVWRVSNQIELERFGRSSEHNGPQPLIRYPSRSDSCLFAHGNQR